MKTFTANRSPMSGLRPPGFRRGRQRERQRRRVLSTLGVIGAMALVALGVVVFVRAGTGAGGDLAGAPHDPSRLVVLSVRPAGDGVPMAAIIGAGGAQFPAAVTLFDGMRFVVPGQGEATVADAAGLPEQGLRVAVANLLGVWPEHYAVMEPRGLGALVDRMGGIRVNLPVPVKLVGQTLGPGPADLTGAQVIEYLDVSGPNLELYWGTVLEGLLAKRTLLLPSDLAETDDARAVGELLTEARGASVEPLPTLDRGGDPEDPYIQADERATAELVSSVFGYPPKTLVPVIVENASGRPGVGQSVAARIIPAGFRVILSANAVEFGKKRTQVIAIGSENLDDAERAQQALGSGEVAVTNVLSGLADVTIMIGSDYGSR